MAGSTPNRLAGLQYLRGLGAVVCVIGHALHTSPGTPRIQLFGVEMFFVISGFVSALAFARMGNELPRARRAVWMILGTLARLLPLYWLALLIACWPWLIAWFESADSLRGWYWNFGPRLQGFALDFLMIPHPNADFGGRWWPQVIPGWTLNLQIWLSAVFALSTLAGRHHLKVVCVVIIGLAGLTRAWDGMPPLLRFYGQPAGLGFVAGVLLYQLYLRWPPRSWSTQVFAPVVLLSAAAFIVAGWSAGSLALTVVSAWGIWLFLRVPVSSGGLARLGGCLGDASYPIYVFHTVLAFPLVAAMFSNGLVSSFARQHIPVDVSGGVLVASRVLMAVLLGVWVHRLLERPLIGIIRRRWRAPFRSSRTAASAMDLALSQPLGDALPASRR